MDHINKLKLKELRGLLCYHFGSEKLNGSPNIVELVEAVTECFRNCCWVLCRRGGGYVVTIEGVCGSGEEMGERSIFLV